MADRRQSTLLVSIGVTIVRVVRESVWARVRPGSRHPPRFDVAPGITVVCTDHIYDGVDLNLHDTNNK